MSAYKNKIVFFLICLFVSIFSGVGYCGALQSTKLKIIENIQTEVNAGNFNNITGVSFVWEIRGNRGKLLAEFRGDKKESIEISFETDDLLNIKVNFTSENKHLFPLISKAIARCILHKDSPPLRVTYSFT